jgi:cysteinyl-tRNA synthetase
VDLKFPHHDNEIAQSEAYFESDNWVKYFLHSGHLTIAGCKMSKSLKNFITIQDALSQYTASQLRLTFLLHSWKDTLDYSPSGMHTAIEMEKKIQEFFLNVKDCLRSSSNPYPKWTIEDLAFQKSIEDAKRGVHVALCDNIDTRSAIFALRDLIGAANIYIQTGKSKKTTLNAPLLKAGAKYISRILRVFGVIQSADTDSFGFKSATESGATVDVEEVILPYIEVLSEFRENVRSTAKSITDTSVKSSILKTCDEIRDDKLPNLGVRLEDHEGTIHQQKRILHKMTPM